MKRTPQRLVTKYFSSIANPIVWLIVETDLAVTIVGVFVASGLTTIGFIWGDVQKSRKPPRERKFGGTFLIVVSVLAAMCLVFVVSSSTELWSFLVPLFLFISGAILGLWPRKPFRPAAGTLKDFPDDFSSNHF